MNFPDRLAGAVAGCGTPLCVGIDPWPERLPFSRYGSDRSAHAVRASAFGRAVVEAAAGRVAAVKPQFAFFEQLGLPGIAALAELCGLAREAGLIVVGDAKRGDIGSTAAAYASSVFGVEAPFPCDALTVSPFLGPDSVEAFLHPADAAEAGIFVLVRTSNAGSARWQEPVTTDLAAWLTEQSANRRGDCGFSNVGAVVGATHPGALASLRQALPRSWLLVPGLGAQGARPRDVLPALIDGSGALIVSARAATFPDHFEPAFDTDPTTWIAERIDAIKAELAEA